MAVVLVSVPVPVAMDLYATVPLGDLCVICGKLGGCVLLLSWPLLLFRPTADAAAVSGIIGAAEERIRVGAAGRPEVARRPTEPKDRPSTMIIGGSAGIAAANGEALQAMEDHQYIVTS